MIRKQIVRSAEVVEGEWISFPGGELEGRRPKVLCPTCRERQRKAARLAPPAAADSQPPAPICFECYRVDLARERALLAARNLHTASEERFQTSLPFEPINRARLERLRAERATARAAIKVGSAQYTDRRRQAQIAARRALERIAAGLRSQHSTSAAGYGQPIGHSAIGGALPAGALPLPDAWLPFVVSR